jgi:hypothetical protein
MKTNQPQQGTAWSNTNLADFAQHAPIHPRTPPPITITITGTEDEIRSYLDGPRLARAVEDIDEAIRVKMEHGNFLGGHDELTWVQIGLADRRMI